MTTYGGRNPFRSGYCSPDDIQHNMRMLSEMSDAIGNPQMTGGPVYTYNQLDPVSGSPVLDPEGNPVEIQEPLVTSSGLARFRLSEDMTGDPPWSGKLVSQDGTATSEDISLHDPLGRYADTTEGSFGYAQSIDNRYEILSVGTAAAAPADFSNEGDVRMRVGGIVQHLHAWFNNVVSFVGGVGDAPDIGTDREFVTVHQNGADGKLYFSVPKAVAVGTGGGGGGDPEPTDTEIPVRYDSTTNTYWIDKTHVTNAVGTGDRKVAANGGDDSPGDLMSKLSASGSAPDDTIGVFWESSGGTVSGKTNAGTLLHQGTTGAGGSTSSVNVSISGVGSVAASILAHEPPEEGHDVLVAKDLSGTWWVVWYSCEKGGE